MNGAIRFKEILVIGPNGEQLGVMSRNDALNKAADLELDLLCVAPNAKVPVCKIIDYGKYRFENQKKAKEAKKKQSYNELKLIRISPVIAKHDLDTKIKHASKWLSSNIKVKVDMRLKGRMITKPEVGIAVLESFISELSEIANVEKKPALEGNTIYCVLAPKKK